jgi:hypothetical protein
MKNTQKYALFERNCTQETHYHPLEVFICRHPLALLLPQFDAQSGQRRVSQPQRIRPAGGNCRFDVKIDH